MEKPKGLHNSQGRDLIQDFVPSSNSAGDEEPSKSLSHSTQPSCQNDASSKTYSLSGSKSSRRPATSMSTTRTPSPRESDLSRIRSRPVPSFSHPIAHVKTTEDQLVDFDGLDDPYRPLNWSTEKKVITIVLYGLITMSATWASSSDSSGTAQVAAHFHVSSFGVGPLLWAPLSEIYGRRRAVFIPMFVATCFSYGSAGAKDFQTLMITRFFSAFFSSAPVTNTGVVLGDLFLPSERGFAMAAYAMAVVGGPVLGPIVSSAVVQEPSLGWRWTEYLTGIVQIIFLTLAVIFVDETYAPTLLIHKARHLRRETGNWALHAKFEEWDVSIQELAGKFLVRPVQLLMTPICFLVASYASFCYGILYMQPGAIPIIFQEIRGWGFWSPRFHSSAFFLASSLDVG
ncbi:related to fluconazole resistance protein [Fusarium mangiferae]|uniref:Related to fluconazole resistance protein n=1 Tax=Fusarium mangiferae TaxID=192010 RepID=A0A1L7UP21_FUSMA|nr:uncharacterized protein FMAN_16271 [Fusarium mangiferae]CVL09066.1 related to fluconazole resistance protein [Fusarium mangiferae]